MNLDNGEVARSMPTVAPTAEMVRRKRWAYSLIRNFRGQPAPYGSAEFLALPDGCPEKVSSIMVAAEAWASDRDNMPDNLARELEDMRRLAKQGEDADYHARAAEHRRRWGQLSLVKRHDDLDARVEEARRDRPGDYKGRNPVRRGEPDAS